MADSVTIERSHTWGGVCPEAVLSSFRFPPTNEDPRNESTGRSSFEPSNATSTLELDRSVPDCLSPTRLRV